MDIPDPDTPLNPGDFDVEIDDPDTPLGPLPATGLNWWPIPVLALVGGALIFIGVKSRKKTEK